MVGQGLDTGTGKARNGTELKPIPLALALLLWKLKAKRSQPTSMGPHNLSTQLFDSKTHGVQTEILRTGYSFSVVLFFFQVIL